MNNVFKDFDVGIRYDLKGSSQGRNFLGVDQDLQWYKDKKLKTALKCNDFRKYEKKIILDEEEARSRTTMGEKRFYRSAFKDVITKDADFFSEAGIIDYSLLVGEVIDIDVDALRE